ncbi:hypothetical protein ABIB62_003765 [Mucilaginibacter sp. UYP25]
MSELMLIKNWSFFDLMLITIGYDALHRVINLSVKIK